MQVPIDCAAAPLHTDLLREAMHALGQRGLLRGNRPDLRHAHDSNEDIGSIRRQCAREFASTLAALGRQSPERLKHPRATYQLYASSVAATYDRLGCRTAYCEEHVALQIDWLLRHGMPAEQLIPIMLAGTTRAGDPVNHMLLLVCPTPVPSEQLLDGAGVLRQIQSRPERCLLSDPWSREKQYGFSPGSTNAAVVDSLRTIMSGVDADFDPVSLAMCEAGISATPQPIDAALKSGEPT